MATFLDQLVLPVATTVALAAIILLLLGFVHAAPASAPSAHAQAGRIPPAPEVRRHHRVRWQLYLREHHTTTRLGQRVRALRRRLLDLQEQLAHARHVQAVATPATPPAHYQQWLCIHGFEGAWDAHTGNGYYGGLQMDMAFQQAYGPELLAAKGTADHWTPLEQMQVAERAYQSGRGFYPWPNTARMCGLI